MSGPSSALPFDCDRPSGNRSIFAVQLIANRSSPTSKMIVSAELHRQLRGSFGNSMTRCTGWVLRSSLRYPRLAPFSCLRASAWLSARAAPSMLCNKAKASGSTQHQRRLWSPRGV